jgi:hypothetical protein
VVGEDSVLSSMQNLSAHPTCDYVAQQPTFRGSSSPEHKSQPTHRDAGAVPGAAFTSVTAICRLLGFGGVARGRALSAGRDVAVSGWAIADALRHVGRDPGRFGDEAADACRTFVLGGDDRLNVIEDRHVEDMDQEDFDELIAGGQARG